MRTHRVDREDRVDFRIVKIADRHGAPGLHRPDIRVRPGILGRLPVGKAGLDFRLDRVGIDIPDHNQHGPAGYVEILVIIDHAFTAGGLDHIDQTDRIAVRYDAVREAEAPERIVPAADRRVAITLLGQDDATLAVDRLVLEQQLAGGLAHQEKGGIDRVLVDLRNIELIADRLITGERIGIRPELQAIALEQRHHLAFGNVGGAVESHVLDEVRKTALIFRLAERTHVEDQTHRRHAGRGIIVQDRIAHAVVEHAIADGRIGRQVADLVHPVMTCGEFRVG